MAPTASTQTTSSSSSSEKTEGTKDGVSTSSSGGYYKFRCKYFLTHSCRGSRLEDQGRRPRSKEENKMPSDTNKASKEGDKKGHDGKAGYESPVGDGKSHGDIVQCEKCHCWIDDRPHTCKPEEKDKYAKDGK
ncbi:uncharacterized protein F4807DRAFT_460942 [Annulohypoxylon truncatum]|uniref:uncharacterized protein n=1 Tax=Annulohypoxylon truncatum TaxID=327061 RepID=UPI002008EB09|nr:uncharacterized protein F4807DRAFT_460942 [Annulohypoxylon truncatum]KAI1209251.1 hypothetical protein F4807DRAFT_460942 [Annulohypoxylon truncatum]